MGEEKMAELYTSPGGRFIRAGTLPRILAHWRSLRKTELEKHFIKYDGELYLGMKWKSCGYNRSSRKRLGDRFGFGNGAAMLHRRHHLCPDALGQLFEFRN
jgi:hypothetical protein